MPTVSLHIGLMKTGTTYLQAILSKNRDLLEDSGLLFPGRRWRSQVVAVKQIKGQREAEDGATDAWDSLCRQIMQFDGNAIISMEFLATADASTVSRIVSSFPGRRVRVIVTARDLARVVPAQWQESVKNGAHLSFDRYLRLITAPGARRLPATRFFWALHDLPKILARWKPHVDPVDLVLVTVPRPGSPPDLLWQRFAQAVELQADGVDMSVRRNDSLGAHSAELLRRLNSLPAAAEDRAAKQVIKQVLANQILVDRRESEPSIILPSQYLNWAMRMSGKLVAEVNGLEPAVIGDVDELVVTHDAKTREVGAPVPTDAELNQLALSTIVDLTHRIDLRQPATRRHRTEPTADRSDQQQSLTRCRQESAEAMRG